MASDYSRDNQGHEFKTLTFLFVIAEDLPAWQAEIEETCADQQLAKDLLVIPDLVSGTMATALRKQTAGRSPLRIQPDKTPVELKGFDGLLRWWLCQDDGALKSVNVEVTHGVDPDNFGFIIRGWGPYEEPAVST